MDRKTDVNEVIDLSNDDTKPACVGSKRHGIDSSDDARGRKKSKSVQPGKRAPIKLYATREDVIERQKQDQNHPCWTQVCTLREILDIGTSPIEWMVIANYIIDFEFLLDEVPELLSIPCVTIFYGHADNTGEGWQQASSGAVDFVPLRPSDPPGRTNPLRSPIPYGVHHSKIFFVGFADGRVRIVIHTANLRYSDIHLKTQAAYVEDFGRKAPNSQSCPFELDLLSYLGTYDYSNRRKWCSISSPHMDATTLLACLRQYDFGTASVALVTSTPGYHRVDGDLKGHLKVRHLLAKHCVRTSHVAQPSPVVAQFSSMGSLTEKYLLDLWDSMDVTTACRPRDVRPSKVKVPLNEKLKIVYPTVAEVRDSIEGYQGGGSVPGPKKNVNKIFLRGLYHRWSPSSCESMQSPLWKPRNVPHIKTYYQLKQSGGQGASMEWFIVTSHNLSKAAWGEVQNSNRGRRLFVRHWELGVLVTPQILECERLLPYGDSSCSEQDATVPLPYQLFPQRYHKLDKPWAIDGVYPDADEFGRRHC